MYIYSLNIRIIILTYYMISILYVLQENMFRVRGSFTTKPNATPNDIRDVLLNHGVVGIYVYMEENFSELKEV